MLAKKEARRKAAAQVKASEMAKKKAEEDKTKAVVPESNKAPQQNVVSPPKVLTVHKGPHVFNRY